MKGRIMDARMTPTKALAHLLHRQLLALLLVTNAIAALLPAWGLWIRDARPLASLTGEPGSSPTLPSLLLGFLLFHVGLRVPGGPGASNGPKAQTSYSPVWRRTWPSQCST